MSAAPSGPIIAATSAARFSATRIASAPKSRTPAIAGIGAREEARRVARRQLHAQPSAPSASRCRIRSASTTASRRSASRSAARLANAEAVSDSGAL